MTVEVYLRAMQAGCTKDEAILYGLEMSGLVIRTPEVAAFYLEAFLQHPNEFVTYKTLRTKGEILAKSQLKSLGIRTNTKIAKQFFETLNDEGLLDPMEAAVIIACCVSNAVCSRRDIHRLHAAMGPDQGLHAQPSNMAAGPCANVVKLSKYRLKASEAILFPLQDCDNAGQCGCLWTLDTDFTDEGDPGQLSTRLDLIT